MGGGCNALDCDVCTVCAGIGCTAAFPCRASMNDAPDMDASKEKLSSSSCSVDTPLPPLGGDGEGTLEGPADEGRTRLPAAAAGATAVGSEGDAVPSP